MNQRTLLEAVDLSVNIGDVQVCTHLDLAIAAGESWGILGPNGAGKTTLLSALAGVRPATHGQVRLLQRPLNELSRKTIAQSLGMLSQNTSFPFEASCLETALVGRHPHLGAWARESDNDRALAKEALTSLGLDRLAERSCLQLSGGEQRRLAMARLLVQDPAVMLLDEPTNHLDPAHQLLILDEVYRRVMSLQRCAIIALHELNLATCYCSHILVLYGDGRWEAGPSDTMLEPGRLSELYGCRVRVIDDGQQRVFAIAARGNLD